MTVMYTDKVANATFGGFLKLVFRWRGSVFKLIWKELIIYLVIYTILSIIYRFALSVERRRVFEKAVNYCMTYQDAINLTFVLGFYVTVVFTRWQDQFSHIPWPDSSCIMTSAYLRGDDERGRLMRRTVIRYVNLSYVMTMRSISLPVKKRFPTMDHMVAAGLMLANEKKILDDIETPYNKYPIPIIWATSIVLRARSEGRISNELAVTHICYDINEFRRKLARILLIDCLSIPIVYTQVVTLCTYMYFAFSLVSQQFVVISSNVSKPEIDLVVPVAPILQFLFYMGWLKVAEIITNPFEDNDDDFDINAYIDRNWTFSYLLVDEMNLHHPELTRDAYWDHVEFELPYTVANAVRTPDPTRTHFASASADAVQIPETMKEFRKPSIAEWTDPKEIGREISARMIAEKRNSRMSGSLPPRGNMKNGPFAPDHQTMHHHETSLDNGVAEKHNVSPVTSDTSVHTPSYPTHAHSVKSVTMATTVDSMPKDATEQNSSSDDEYKENKNTEVI